MAFASTTNITKNIIQAYETSISNIVQNITNNVNTDQIITVNAGGSIIGNDFSQNGTNNIVASSLLTALTNQTSQIDLSNQISQLAKSSVSGISLGSFSDSTNLLYNSMTTSIALSSSISQNCSASSNINQVVTLTSGEDIINNKVLQNALNNLTSSCVENALSNQTSLSKIQNALTQSAVSEVKGLTGLDFLLMAIAAVLVMGAPVIIPAVAAKQVGGSVVMKILFVILLLVGIILLVLYVLSIKDNSTMSSMLFSTLIKNGSYNPVVQSSSSKYSSSILAENACLNDSACMGYDWNSYTIKNPSSNTPVNVTVVEGGPITTFYSSFSIQPTQLFKTPDNSNVWRVPNLTTSNGKPTDTSPANPLSGDVYLDSQGGKLYKYNGTWLSILDINNPIPLDTTIVPPTSWIPKISTRDDTEPTTVTRQMFTNDSNTLIVYDSKSFIRFTLWILINNIPVKCQNINGPGLQAIGPHVAGDTSKSLAPNASGLKTKITTRSTWMLIVGIGCTLIGIIGCIYSFKKTSPPPTTPPSTKV